jgi:Leucine-rich repeat (LRR) protein
MTTFANAIAVNKTLTSLNLSGNHVGPDLADALLATVDKSSTLAILNLENNDICSLRIGEFSGNALAHVCRALAPNASHIRELNLAGNNIQAAGVEMLLATQGLENIEVLNLSRNGLGDAGAAIAIFAAQLPNIHTLDLSNNGIVDATPLSVLAKGTASLRTLNVAHNVLGDGPLDSFTTFIDAVANRNQLVSLDISGNELGGKHTGCLAFLSHTATPPFETLLLQQNPSIPLEDIIKIIQGLARNTSIRTVKFTSQEGDHEPILAALDAMLQQNKVICDLDAGLSVDLIEEDAVENIKQRLLMNALR